MLNGSMNIMPISRRSDCMPSGAASRFACRASSPPDGTRPAAHHQVRFYVFRLPHPAYEAAMTPRILVDADACPVKDEIYRVAWRTDVPVTIVSNAYLRVPGHRSSRGWW